MAEQDGFGPAHGLGQNGGPPLEQSDAGASWRRWCWRRAHRKARAEALGLSYRDHAPEIMERGRYL